MITTIRPYGATSNDIRYRYEEDGKYYIVDNAYNQFEVSKHEYMKLKAPIKKIIRRKPKNEVQWIKSW